MNNNLKLKENEIIIKNKNIKLNKKEIENLNNIINNEKEKYIK